MLEAGKGADCKQVRPSPGAAAAAAAGKPRQRAPFAAPGQRQHNEHTKTMKAMIMANRPCHTVILPAAAEERALTAALVEANTASTQRQSEQRRYQWKVHYTTLICARRSACHTARRQRHQQHKQVQGSCEQLASTDPPCAHGGCAASASLAARGMAQYAVE